MFSNKQFENFRQLVYEQLGIYIDDKKKELFLVKLHKTMTRRGVSSYDDYFSLIRDASNQEELQEFINVITTNTTEFFRENKHFVYIAEHLSGIMKANPRIAQQREIRIWCAGCSSGQEPVTLSMVLQDVLGPEFTIKILATDISSAVLLKAMSGVYSEQDCSGIPKHYFTKHFTRSDDGFKVSVQVLRTITYRHFNLMNEFTFKKGFDMIFCRNVMIYFNTKVQQKLVHKYYGQLVQGGLFFIGHSESLINKKHQFKNLAPSLYMK